MRIFVGVVLLSGCVTLQPVPLTVPENKWVEAQPLPVDPATEKVEAPDGEWAVALNAGDCWDEKGEKDAAAPKPCPEKSGILFSEGKAGRLKLYEISYKALRLNYEADRQVFGAQRLLYEARLRDAGEAAQRDQPGWVKAHAAELGVLGGMVVGAAMAVGVIYAVAPAMK